MSCTPAPVSPVPAPDGWRAIYRVDDHHVVLPVAFFVLQRCEHGYTAISMVMPANGVAVEAEAVRVEGKDTTFVAVVSPSVDVDAMFLGRSRDLRSVAQA